MARAGFGNAEENRGASLSQMRSEQTGEEAWGQWKEGVERTEFSSVAGSTAVSLQRKSGEEAFHQREEVGSVSRTVSKSTVGLEIWTGPRGD